MAVEIFQIKMHVQGLLHILETKYDSFNYLMDDLKLFIKKRYCKEIGSNEEKK